MDKLKLVPVMELEPSSFSKSELPFPNETGSESPQAWDEYWRNSLNQSGISDLEPYELGSWLVPLQQILSKSKTFELILKSELQNYECSNSNPDPDEFSSLSGGFIIEVNGDAIIYPQCCGSLENISEWKHFALSENDEEEMLWIGHPWLMVKSLDKDTLQLRKTAEYGEPDEPVIITVNKKELLTALISCESELQKLNELLKDTLPKFLMSDDTEKLKEICKVMVYGHSQIQ